MTDITRLINSIKRRTSSARELGYDVLFVPLDDLDVLADSLETALRANTAQAGHIEQLQDIKRQLEKMNSELESRTVTVKLPEPFKLAKSSSGLMYYYADEVNEALTAQGIKWEAE
ncbi:hypothetical protein ACHAZ8_004839 [Klebsiella aerogenes]